MKEWKEQPFLLAIVLAAGLYFGDKWLSSSTPTKTDFQSETLIQQELTKQQLAALRSEIAELSSKVDNLQEKKGEQFTRTDYEKEKQLLLAELSVKIQQANNELLKDLLQTKNKEK